MSNSKDRLRLVLFGMRCEGTTPSLRVLIEAGHAVDAVLLPAPRSMPPLTTLPPRADPGRAVGLVTLPVVNQLPVAHELDALARARGIPLMLAPDLRHAAVRDALAALAPDLIVVSCFTLRVPPSVLALPRLGCVNLHPSLLPRHRGPEPVFWALRDGETETGVTIHLMDEGFDTGPIVLQERVTIPDGVRLPDFERELSERGARLLLAAIDRLAAGTITPVPQDHRGATGAPYPTPEDFVIPTGWSARRAFAFARGAAPLDGSLTVEIAATGRRFPIRDAAGYDETAVQSRAIEGDSGEVSVQFTPGVARFQT